MEFFDVFEFLVNIVTLFTGGSGDKKYRWLWILARTFFLTILLIALIAACMT